MHDPLRSPWISFGLAAAGLLALAGCKRDTPAEKAERPAPVKAEAESEPSGVKAVYPSSPKAVPEEVRALCDALHGLPNRRKAECCAGTPGVVVTGECERNLAGAIETGGLALDPAQTKACTGALSDTVEGCSWVGPHMPKVPEVCVRALIPKREAGEVCRSSLECKGGLICAGVSPTQAGRCAAAAAPGAVCNTGVDPLAPYLRLDADSLRPACADGFCDKNICRPALDAGALCRASVMCKDGLRCASGQCIAGSQGEAGAACTGADCAEGLRCANYVCTEPRPEGAPCTSHAQCQGACVQGACKVVCSAAELMNARPMPNLPVKKIPGLKLKLPPRKTAP